MFNRRKQYKCDSIDLPILLIGMHGTVEGATRLQKYAFLSAMHVKNIKRINFFSDWQCGKSGAFSAYFAQCIDLAVDEGYVKTSPIINGYGFTVDVFSITEKGEPILRKVKDMLPDFYDEILKITSPYQDISLFRLLEDVFYKYPKYAIYNEDICTGKYESDSYAQQREKNVR